MDKVVITVQGGNVQAVHSTSPYIQCEVLDVDNMKEKGMSKIQIDDILFSTTDQLFPI